MRQLSPILHLLTAFFSTTSQSPSIATPSIQDLPALPRAFVWRVAEVLASELIGCLLVKRQAGGELLCGVIVETEVFSQEEPACQVQTWVTCCCIFCPPPLLWIN